MYQDRELPLAASPSMGSPHGASFRAMTRTTSPGAAALLAAAAAGGSPLQAGADPPPRSFSSLRYCVLLRLSLDPKAQTRPSVGASL